ncbi:hypothetical protein HanXRQr2_Chr15g0679171 [Helianthus annuus]|uniref:Uncharacterized protein n=1 Tax=Helianthus annuus TaxID=4232 RepID=A0A9K3H1S7_HELAN|nr:hypothetical protein HanXRQr2_Chr15g0679171 [Helianthus annuus]
MIMMTVEVLDVEVTAVVAGVPSAAATVRWIVIRFRYFSVFGSDLRFRSTRSNRVDSINTQSTGFGYCSTQFRLRIGFRLTQYGSTRSTPESTQFRLSQDWSKQVNKSQSVKASQCSQHSGQRRSTQDRNALVAR